MKAFAASFGAALGLVLLGGMAQAVLSPYWGSSTPSSTGPWLGDTNYNINSLFIAIHRGAGHGYVPALSVSQTVAQANCTQLGDQMLQQVTTSAATGYVCLPPAQPGKTVFIANGSGQTVDIYTSATGYNGTADTINGTAGTTAYTAMTTGLRTFCFVPAANAWYCNTPAT